MGRRKAVRDDALPPLTFQEAARLLGVDVGALMIWTMESFQPSEGRWSEWKSGARPLPEKLIRRFLMEAAANGLSTQHIRSSLSAPSMELTREGRRRLRRKRVS